MIYGELTARLKKITTKLIGESIFEINWGDIYLALL